MWYDRDNSAGEEEAEVGVERFPSFDINKTASILRCTAIILE